MTNADKFKEIFGIYATELWARPEKEFLEWLNADVPDKNVGDTISRRAAISAAEKESQRYGAYGYMDTKSIIDMLEDLPSAEPRWIPVKTRPMDEEEKRYWEEHYDYAFGEDYDGTMFDCPMPEDGQEVWVCSKCGNIWQDTCEVDVGIGLEDNGDWDDIVAWMPFKSGIWMSSITISGRSFAHCSSVSAPSAASPPTRYRERPAKNSFKVLRTSSSSSARKIVSTSLLTTCVLQRHTKKEHLKKRFTAFILRYSQRT